MGTTIIFDSVPFERATEAIGIYGVTGALSNALSPFLGEMLLTAGFTHYTLFFISTVFASASLIATIGLAADTAAVKDYVGTSESKNTLFNSRMLALMAISLIFGGMFGVMVTYLPNYVRSVSGYRYSTFFISYIAALVTIRFGFLGRINQIDKTRVIMFVFAAGALSHLLLHFLISWTMLVAVGVLYGIMHGFLYPTLNTAAIALAPCEKSAAANALYTAVFNSGIMIFTIATGFLIDATGAYLSAFYLCGFTGLTAVVITIFFSKRGMLEPFKSQ
jgi:MFS family permease